MIYLIRKKETKENQDVRSYFDKEGGSSKVNSCDVILSPDRVPSCISAQTEAESGEEKQTRAAGGRRGCTRRAFLQTGEATHCAIEVRDGERGGGKNLSSGIIFYTCTHADVDAASVLIASPQQCYLRCTLVSSKLCHEGCILPASIYINICLAMNNETGAAAVSNQLRIRNSGWGVWGG